MQNSKNSKKDGSLSKKGTKKQLDDDEEESFKSEMPFSDESMESASRKIRQ